MAEQEDTGLDGDYRSFLREIAEPSGGITRQVQGIPEHVLTVPNNWRDMVYANDVISQEEQDRRAEARDAIMANFSANLSRYSEQPLDLPFSNPDYGPSYIQLDADRALAGLGPYTRVTDDQLVQMQDIIRSVTALNVITPEQELGADLRTALDVNADNSIDIYDRLDALSGPTTKQDAIQRVAEIQSVIDTNNDGHITNEEMTTAISSMGADGQNALNIIGGLMQRAGLENVAGEHTQGNIQVALTNFTAPTLDEGIQRS